MSDFQHYNEIARLIALEVSEELTTDDMLKLQAWVDECPENKRLYCRIKNSANFNARNIEIQKIDILTGWKSIFPLIEKRRKSIFQRKMLRVAATILLPLLITGGIYFYTQWQPKQQHNIAHLCKIHPGSTKAVLILNNGDSLLLDSSENQTIKEKDGTLIDKSEGKLHYTNSSVGTKVQPIYNTINTPRGGEYVLVLSDGTRVYLNAMSRFKYPVKFLGDSREVELSGEAYFEVTKDVGHPFIVRTPEINIEVLGTSFNLSAYENTEKIVTTLIEGRVKLISHSNRESMSMQPEEQATFHVKDGLTEIERVDVNLYTAWKDGNFIFHDARLEDIMITLTRWYSMNVLYTNESVKELRFSGNLDRYGDINQILDIIGTTKKIKIKIDQNTILFSRK